MIKQLTLMFLAGVLISLIVESHHLGLIYTNNQSFFYIIGYLIGYSLTLIIISLFLATIPCIIYWAMKIKKPPKFFILGWTIWILIIVALAINQLYSIATPQEPTSTNSSAVNKNTAQNVYKLVSGSIYTVESTDTKNKSIASGGAVAVSKDYLATNCHIIINPKNISVLINHENKQAELYSAHNDLCIISIKGASFTPVKMRRANTVEIGEEVYAVGNPEDIEKTISNGIISNKLNVRGLTILQTNASISHGSSGGGLFDHDGNLIGITTGSKAGEDTQNINFALPTEMIEAAILEPTIDSMVTDQSDDTKASTQKNNNEQIIPSENDYTVIGTYGKDRIVLAYWYNRCYILIPGRYNPSTINSVAVWIPSSPNVLLLLSKVTSIDGVFQFIKWFMKEKNTDYAESKSYVFYGKTLERLDIISVNGVKQPAYLTSANKPYTESLVSEDSLIGQFYNYSQTGYDGLTSITFGLSGFTDALDSYNENCAAKR